MKVKRLTTACLVLMSSLSTPITGNATVTGAAGFSCMVVLPEFPSPGGNQAECLGLGTAAFTGFTDDGIPYEVTFAPQGGFDFTYQDGGCLLSGSGFGVWELVGSAVVGTEPPTFTWGVAILNVSWLRIGLTLLFQTQTSLHFGNGTLANQTLGNISSGLFAPLVAPGNIDCHGMPVVGYMTGIADLPVR